MKRDVSLFVLGMAVSLVGNMLIQSAFLLNKSIDYAVGMYIFSLAIFLIILFVLSFEEPIRHFVSKYKIKEFLNRMEWNKTSFKQLVEYFNKDVKEFNRKRTKHKIVDLYFEIKQMAIKKNIDLDKELRIHMKDMKKEYGAKK
ncbi:MAG: hypothetical protein PHU12_03235 [Candidatus Aenigmarchaeota archaeon]|nr:hypothetical protein [Candidatus Aenigmarchaeota archaeon]